MQKSQVLSFRLKVSIALELGGHMVWSSIIAEQHRRKNGHHRFSSCKRLCRGVSDLLSGDFCRDCKVKGDRICI